MKDRNVKQVMLMRGGTSRRGRVNEKNIEGGSG
jgi:hypothetical protein